jgi:hypothetical protein
LHEHTGRLGWCDDRPNRAGWAAARPTRFVLAGLTRQDVACFNCLEDGLAGNVEAYNTIDGSLQVKLDIGLWARVKSGSVLLPTFHQHYNNLIPAENQPYADG